jgi:hypothetical protein
MSGVMRHLEGNYHANGERVGYRLRQRFLKEWDKRFGKGLDPLAKQVWFVKVVHRLVPYDRWTLSSTWLVP